MTRIPSNDEIYIGRFWSPIEGDQIECELCPRACKLSEGQRAFCFVRQNQGGEMVLTTYGRSSGFCIDPIEKKPLNHFYPGSSVLSFGTAGCNLGCKFCQNWSISKAREWERLSERALPGDIAAAAERHACKSVAFTYNDPVIFAEYAIDVAAACRERGIRTVAVTAGYLTEQARPEFFAAMDAVNVDLKAFRESFYHTLTFSHLEPVLDSLRYLRNETDIWFEVTTLLIPGHNDDDESLHRQCEWFVRQLGPEVPLHFSAFHPDYRMRDVEATPPATLQRARTLAKSHGIRHVYTGNVHDLASQSSYCAACDALLIERDWYALGTYRLTPEGSCPDCGQALAGRFDAAKGAWGAKRLPVVLS
ncbi:AmmeMemoRadiSam system radical SAM enzyme [Haliangium ochraceum]|uniref:Radical SAM domain protein n=1 Tax=Haliangium ochraceum (strain DSM 14365 / JCM 11303 / SMP-2) TaxID=502025 RepID=D0LIJ7_HALO1|nr:AmmeMemoRadiSam system radical SAM enzyme [Haliangium ochraceum]ACY18353.1 Radical SAM domain protein [Haliangium ochraceum DSM 14365]